MTDALITALDETWTSVHELLSGLGDTDWHRPTPCSDWDVRDLAAHLGAIESQFQGMPQPDTPLDPTGGLDSWTAAGVAARRDWTLDQVVAEVDEAAALQLRHLRGLGDDGWNETTFGPMGETTRRNLAELRLFDIYLHLLDLRTALEQSVTADTEPTAAQLCCERAVTLTPWGAVKKAGLPDGARVRFELDGPGGTSADLVITGGRGAFVDAEGDVSDRVSGHTLAYLLVASGRVAMADAAGGVKGSGEQATRLLDGYRIFA